MKAEALTDSIAGLPKARIVVELSSGQKVKATGFIVRDNERGEPTIIIKASRKLVL